MPNEIKGKTAFLVIHGVGPHSAYEVCDEFARGFTDVFQKNTKKGIKLGHVLKKRQGPVQSCISLSLPGRSDCIDFYEYFWDTFMIHKVLPKEAWDLLVKASKNAKAHYDNEPAFKKREMVARVSDLDQVLESPFFRKRRRSKKEGEQKYERGDLEFRPQGYLRLIGGLAIWVVAIIPYIPWVVSALTWLSKLEIPIFKQVYGTITSIFKAAAGLFQNQLEKYFIGDLVRYLDMDPRSKHYETRQKIINGAVDELRALMDDDYDRIIIAGHSLGSVIAYDAINRIILQMNAGRMQPELAEKITGLVTFGSPLDKIAFFFREYIPEEKNIRRKILSNRYTFRTSSLLKQGRGIEDPDPFNQLPEIVWLNFWHAKDYISGKLDLYDLKAVPPKNVNLDKKDGNICITDKMSFISAHGCYWGASKKGTKQMQEAIVTEFF